MSTKKVLVVENKQILLALLTDELRKSGFEVFPASNAAEARQLAERHWEELDVVSLDMLLDDPDEPLTTGADIGIEFRRKKDSLPPESLIYSDINEIDFYRLALKLGAAVYLLKTEAPLPVVVQHVRVLALKHALNGENPKVAAEVARIAARSRTQSEAILTFCRQVLRNEFEACLGTDFVILFTEENTTVNCADNAGLPPRSDVFYHTLQALAHGKGNLTEPFILDADELDASDDPDILALHRKFNQAAFLPLSLSNDKKLSIGILPKGPGETEAADAARALCTVLAQYLRPTVLENVISIWSQWTELHATRNSTAKLCLSVGQEIKDGLEGDDVAQTLSDLANDLNDTGQYLTQLDNRSWREEPSSVSIREVAKSSWDLITSEEERGVPRLDLRGDCAVHAQNNDVVIVVSRLLQWFLYRSKSVPIDVEPVVRVKCEDAGAGTTITFEDTSHRLPKKLREDLFAPFTQAISTPFADLTMPQPASAGDGGETSSAMPPTSGRYLPLYLAKMLVEGRYRGLLEDHSDEITGHGYGHRVMMYFPKVNRTN